MKGFLATNFLGNTMSSYVSVAAFLVFGAIAILLFKAIVLKRLKRWAERSATQWDDFAVSVLEKTAVPLLLAALVYTGVSGLKLHPTFSKGLHAAFMAFVTFLAARTLILSLDLSIQGYLSRHEKDSSSNSNGLRALWAILKFLVWGGALVFFLDNLGFHVTSIVAGLGIGGVAVALAAQSVLGDLFSYFAIFFDKPFEIGDFITVGDHMGTVEYIGIKTTRLRSLGGEEIVFHNSDLTGSRLNNFKRMAQRRIVFSLGLTYDTDLPKLKRVPELLKSIITRTPDTTFDRAHFASYGPSSLVFEVVYFVLSADYNKYMDIQQQINFTIREEFDKLGLSFAFPTQTIELAKSK